MEGATRMPRPPLLVERRGDSGRVRVSIQNVSQAWAIVVQAVDPLEIKRYELLTGPLPRPEALRQGAETKLIQFKWGNRRSVWICDRARFAA